ncbi:uncharacterized protein TNCV_3205751 [Trichonephila clavipes]|nr:uncharacterized protein TNCV_3205751 [Trichonephila clavipes]
MTGKTPAELFLGRKLITPFQKLVMVSDGTEFAVGDIEKLFDEARRNTKAKYEKWAKYYDRQRSNESQYSRKNGSGERRELEEKGTSLKNDEGERHTSIASNRRPLVRSSLGS